MKKNELLRGFLQVFAGALKIAKNSLVLAVTRKPCLQRLKPVPTTPKGTCFSLTVITLSAGGAVEGCGNGRAMARRRRAGRAVPGAGRGGTRHAKVATLTWMGEIQPSGRMLSPGTRSRRARACSSRCNRDAQLASNAPAAKVQSN